MSNKPASGEIDLAEFTGLIFDMDGTLIDSMGWHSESWMITAERFGYQLERDYIHKMGGVPSYEISKILNREQGLNHDPEEVVAFKNATYASIRGEPIKIQPTFEIFMKHKAEKRVGVGTGARRADAELLLTQTGLIEHLHALVTSSDVEQGKPHPETFLRVAELMGVSPRQCVVFEDTEIGVQAARDAGMACILVSETFELSRVL